MLEIYLELIFVFITGLVISLITYARWEYGTLEKAEGLPVVIKPAFIGGSDPFVYKKVICFEDVKNVAKYGPIFGYYEGREAQIYIADPQLVRHILVKDFNHFQNKRIMDLGHPLINETMDVLPYEKWKIVRSQLSPQLTTGRIRSMSNQILDSITDWMPNMWKMCNGGGQFNPKKAFTALTLDVIARCAFGSKITVFDNDDNIFIKNVQRLVREDEEVGPMLTIIATFPFLAKLRPFLPFEVTNYFADLLKRILSTRRNNIQSPAKDFVDVLNEMIEKCSANSEYQNLGITETTVMSQGIIFLVAGYETTALTLTMLSYRLPKNEHIQKKLVTEVDTYLQRHNGKIEHESLGELEYLNACVSETLRMNPPLIRIERVCQKDWHHEPTGLTIKRGTTIQIPIYAIHYNAVYFPDPFSFKPERFLPENQDRLNPYASLSFGQGPHNCIGMRFAKEEILMTMASVLKEFRIESTEDSNLKLLPGRNFLNNYEPFDLKLQRR